MRTVFTAPPGADPYISCAAKQLGVAEHRRGPLVGRQGVIEVGAGHGPNTFSTNQRVEQAVPVEPEPDHHHGLEPSPTRIITMKDIAAGARRSDTLSPSCAVGPPIRRVDRSASSPRPPLDQSKHHQTAVNILISRLQTGASAFTADHGALEGAASDQDR